MKTKAKTARRFAAWFFGLIALFTLLMTLAYCIPTERIEYRQDLSAYIVAAERDAIWESNPFNVDASRQDYFTDALMLDRVLAQDAQASPLKQAMSMNDYGRYWHGYMAWLRPLLVLFSLWDIRYLYMCAFFLLTGLVMALIGKRLPGVGCALAFLASLVACYIVIIPTSLQYCPVFLVMLSAALVLLLRYDRLDESGLLLLFMVVGMVTNFVDLLTVPLLTLGIPLLLLLEMDMHRRGEERVRMLLRRIVLCSLCWGMGYALCWIAKWCLGSLIVGENVFSSAQDKATQWLGGTDTAPQGWRIDAIVNNVAVFFLPHGKRMAAWLLVPAAAYALCFACFRNPHWRRALALLPVSLYPYVWYAVFSYHSFVHTWFTYRLQAITLLGVLLFLIELVDWKQCAEAIRRRN